jgi:site-specific DNA-methyltransferase (adenine-specific)
MFRVLNTLAYYGSRTAVRSDNMETRLRYVAEHLVNIDYDQVFENKVADSESLVARLMEAWQTYMTNSYTNLLNAIANCEIEVGEVDQRLLNALGSKSTGDALGSFETPMDDDREEQGVNKGILASSSSSSGSGSDADSEEKEQEIDITLNKDILRYVVPFVAFMTLSSGTSDLHEMMGIMGAKNDLRAMFDEQCFMWWGKRAEYHEKIEYLIQKHISKSSDIYNIAMVLKTQIQGLIHDKEKVVRFITDNLKPKEEEKKQLGAVYTPPSLINDMLDKLPVDVWMNPDLKWLDPAAGIGNFEVFVFHRLMDGLLDEFPDEEERKKHILENMLYVAEIDPKSVHIYKQVFDGERYALNVHEGDFLKMDPEAAFGVNRFDVVVGNPPYQESFQNLKTGSVKPIYNEFITRALSFTQHLTFVTPSRWFAGGRGLDIFRKEMLSRTDIVYIHHIPQKQADRMFGNSVEIKGGISFFHIDMLYSGTCDFNGIPIDLTKYDILLDPRYTSIVDKAIASMEASKRDSLKSICKGSAYSGIKTNDTKLLEGEAVDTYKCYVSKQKGLTKYIKKTDCKQRDYSKWKVITSEAYNSGNNFGNLYVLRPDEICNQTYILFETESYQEACSLVSYLDTYLVRFLVSCRKVSQHMKPDTLKWAPLPDMDREYTDNDVYAMYGIDSAEIELIQKTVKKTTVCK